MHTLVHVSMRARVCRCVNACMYARVHTRIRVRARAGVCVCVCACVYVGGGGGSWGGVDGVCVYFSFVEQ